MARAGRSEAVRGNVKANVEPCPGVLATFTRPRIDTVEALEDAWEVTRIDAGAVVDDGDLDVLGPRGGAHDDGRARAAVLDRIVDEVGEHLLERSSVGARGGEAGRRLAPQLDALLVGAVA